MFLKNSNVCGGLSVAFTDMREFIAACVQIAVTPNEVEPNVAKGVQWLRRVVDGYDADLVVFPETVTTGYDTGLSAKEL